MPSFTAQLPNLQLSGPSVDMPVWIGTAVEDALRKSGSRAQDPVPVKGMIDTGATVSVFQPSVVQQLGLQPVGAIAISTSTAEGVLCYQYSIRLCSPTT